MNYPNYGTAYVATATGLQCITSANAQIIGIMFQGSGTGTVQIYSGATASVPLSNVIRAFTTAAAATVNSAVYYPFPANAPGGITINMGASADPKLTLFWNPTGGA